MATHSSTLAWEIPWGAWCAMSMESQKGWTQLSDSTVTNGSSRQPMRTKTCKKLGVGAETKILLFTDVNVYLEKPK